MKTCIPGFSPLLSGLAAVVPRSGIRSDWMTMPAASPGCARLLERGAAVRAHDAMMKKPSVHSAGRPQKLEAPLASAHGANGMLLIFGTFHEKCCHDYRS